MRHLTLSALNAESFAAFGEVIDTQTDCEQYPINDGLTQRHHALATVDCSEGDGKATLSMFRAQPIDGAFVLRKMERHPLGSQAFINTSGLPYAVVVAPPGELDESVIRGFMALPGQSISYRRGVWHHFLLALGAPADFVVVDRVGPGDNCDEQDLVEPLQLVLET
ncbi:MAG: ureidoglycolate lyase [Halieaceae bacterium]|jgi:ureidoglycolate lyase